MPGDVTYIPPATAPNFEEDGAAEEDRLLKATADKRSPLKLFGEDCFLLFKNLRSFPDVFLPLRKARPLPGVPKTSLFFGHAVVGLLSIIQLPLVFLSLPAAAILPGWLSGSIAAVGSTAMWLLARTTWGPLVVDSQVDFDRDKFKNEYWMFVNGIATSHAQLQSTVNNLSATFGRPVTGVHNQSWGIPGDLIECLIQRSFSYDTQDVRVASAAIEKALEDDAISKVVVIAHSQGGLIVSLVLDRLYAILPAEVFRKLEIYTFGSAASYFHNPLVNHAHSESISPVQRRTLAKAATDSLVMSKADLATADLEIPNRLIPIIEHYVNGRDLVPRWGVLYHILLSTGTTYSGRVFVHDKQSGHLFDEHYLSTMFPLLDLDKIRDGDGSAFLNHRVSLSQDVQGGHRWWGIWRARSWGRSPTTSDIATFRKRGPPSRESSGASEYASGGTTVKDLSKLWRYMDGGIA